MVIREVGISIRPSTITPITQVTMVDCCIELLPLFIFMEVFMTTKELIVVVMVEDMDLGLKRLAIIRPMYY